MIIRCGENACQALTQSHENLYSNSEYVPFNISLNQKEKHF